MKLRGLGIAAALTLALGCNGKTVHLGGGEPAAASTTTTTQSDAWTFEPPSGVTEMTTATKVDILLAVDNSLGMAGKSELLAQALPAYLAQVAAKTPDIHLGIVTSSLGNVGPAQDGVCPTDAAHPHNDDHAQLWRDTVVAPSGVLAMTQASELTAFSANAQQLVRGVGQSGCGLEAQMESMYRFLVQPDPWEVVTIDNFAQADQGDAQDAQVLADRKAFLRPDSLLVVLMLTDEDDSSADPMAVGGFGYAFEQRDFPGSRVRRGATLQGTTAPRGTSICDANPGDPACTSCGFAANCDQALASCHAVRSDANCTSSPVPGGAGAGYDGFYGPQDDDLNIRFQRMKQRYGVDPQYPLDRYLAGFNSSSVPDRVAEHAITTEANGQRKIADYTHKNKCTNPLYATGLPAVQGDELCNLARGPRTPAFVMFGLITGVPSDLADVATPNWTAINGADPNHYDLTGIDARMAQSSTPRAGVAGDYDPKKKDLEFACTFPRATPLDCSGDTPADECLCNPDPTLGTPSPYPLCSATTPTLQITDKAYPAARQLRFAQAVGGPDRVTIGSICQPASTGYAGFMTRLGTATAAKLQ